MNMSMLGLMMPQGGKPKDLWLPEDASTFGDQIDWLFYGILWVNIIFFVLIAALTLWFVIKYRRKDPMQETGGPTHNWFLEITWCAIPLAIVGWMWFVGFRDFMHMRTIPRGDAYNISVTAQKWGWDFTYPNGANTPDLHVPPNTKVVLTLNSLDVLHSFYVSAFRTKMDVVPGRLNEVWFEASKPGVYALQCTEYCGTGHSNMNRDVTVYEDREAFDAWLKSYDPYEGLSPEQAGEVAFKNKGCTQCHNVEGKDGGIGPTLLGVIGRKREFTNGESMTTDANYVRESILEPKAKIVKGYEGVMPSYKGRLTDKEINYLIAWFQSLGN